MRATCSLTAIVLAAGQSQRMGERNKLLLDAGGRPVLVRVLEAFAEADVPAVIVVTGAEREQVTDVAASVSGIRVVHNAAYRSGMASSIRCGVQAAPLETDGYMLCPGDLPLLCADTVRRLVHTFSERPKPCIVRPTYREQPGHPVLFDRAFREELLDLQGDRGAREVLQRHAHALTQVDVEDEGVLRDVDTPEALRIVRQQIPDEPTPSSGSSASGA